MKDRGGSRAETELASEVFFDGALLIETEAQDLLAYNVTIM